MQRFKTFSSASCDDDFQRLAEIINAWLAAEHPQVHFMAQSALDSHLVVSFIYAAGFVEERYAAEAAAVPDVFERTLEDMELDPADSVTLPLPEIELPY